MSFAQHQSTILDQDPFALPMFDRLRMSHRGYSPTYALRKGIFLSEIKHHINI